MKKLNQKKKKKKKNLRFLIYKKSKKRKCLKQTLMNKTDFLNNLYFWKQLKNKHRNNLPYNN